MSSPKAHHHASRKRRARPARSSRCWWTHSTRFLRQDHPNPQRNISMRGYLQTRYDRSPAADSDRPPMKRRIDKLSELWPHRWGPSAAARADCSTRFSITHPPPTTPHPNPTWTIFIHVASAARDDGRPHHERLFPVPKAHRTSGTTAGSISCILIKGIHNVEPARKFEEEASRVLDQETAKQMRDNPRPFERQTSTR